MEPKEKAKDLYDKFYYKHVRHSERGKISFAKYHALICVDEIISACEYNHVDFHNTDWWLKVKEEIEKLKR